MRETRLCLYAYDALDRLARTSPVNDAESERFYCKRRLATEIQGQLKKSIFQYDDQLLAEQQRAGAMVDTMVISTDQQRSVLQTAPYQPSQSSAYSPYGYLPINSASPSLL